MKITLPQIKKEQIRAGFNQGTGMVKDFGLNTVRRLHIQRVDRKDKLLAALSYLFLGGILVNFFKKDPDDFLKFHIKQSIILFVLFSLLFLIPEYGFTLFMPIILLLMIVNLIISALGGTLKLIPR